MSTTTVIVRRFADPGALAASAALDTARRINSSIIRRGRCRIALAGGNTPRQAYRLLAAQKQQRIDWRRVQVFWSDERCVPRDSRESNYRMAWQTLLSRVPIPREQIHRIEGERPPADSARTYSALLAEAPLDLVLLGMGTDGHIASLFPGQRSLQEPSAYAVAVDAPKPLGARVSLTLRAINEAHAVCFWISGAGKADIVARVLRDRARGCIALPAARVHPDGELVWYLDEDAARRLDNPKQRLREST